MAALALTDWMGVRGLCSAMNHSGDMNGATAPATLQNKLARYLTSRRGLGFAHREIGSRTVMTNLGNGGRIDVMMRLW